MEACFDRGLPITGDESELRKLLEDWTKCLLTPMVGQMVLKIEAIIFYSIIVFIKAQ